MRTSASYFHQFYVDWKAFCDQVGGVDDFAATTSRFATTGLTGATEARPTPLLLVRFYRRKSRASSERFPDSQHFSSVSQLVWSANMGVKPRLLCYNRTSTARAFA